MLRLSYLLCHPVICVVTFFIGLVTFLCVVTCNWLCDFFNGVMTFLRCDFFICVSDFFICPGYIFVCVLSFSICIMTFLLVS